MIEIIRERHDTPIPYYATQGSAAFELAADWDIAAGMDPVIIPPGVKLLIPTGLRIKMPAGTAGLVLPKSGQCLTKDMMVANSPGLIDCDYRDEIKILVKNIGVTDLCIRRHERIAQMMIVPYHSLTLAVVQSFSKDEFNDRSGGFGSTGVY